MSVLQQLAYPLPHTHAHAFAHTTSPQAACVHPLWNNGHPGLRRFARWAIGDGQLIEMYPRLTYMAAPNASELLLLLAALAAAAAAVAVLALAAARLQGTGLLAAAGGAGGGGAAAAVAAAAAGRAVRGLVAAGVGLVAAELGLELVRHCCNPVSHASQLLTLEIFVVSNSQGIPQRYLHVAGRAGSPLPARYPCRNHPPPFCACPFSSAWSLLVWPSGDLIHFCYSN